MTMTSGEGVRSLSLEPDQHNQAHKKPQSDIINEVVFMTREALDATGAPHQQPVWRYDNSWTNITHPFASPLLPFGDVQ